MIEQYINKLARKEAAIARIQEKENDADHKMAPIETIHLHTYQAEAQLLREFIEDLKTGESN